MKFVISRRFLFLPILIFTLLPISISAKGTPLSPEAEAIKKDIIFTFNNFLKESGNSTALKKLTTLQEICDYQNEKMATIVPVYTARFREFESRISTLKNKDEKLLLSMFLERNIIDLTQDSVTPQEYSQMRTILFNLNHLSRNGLKDCSLVYSQLGGVYSFMISHERGGSFITKGPKLLKAYNKAYELDPENYDALNGIALGDLFAPVVIGGDIDKAISNFSIIIDKTPYNTERFVALVFMGVAFEKQGKRDEAIKAWKQADTLYPGIIAGKFLRVIEIGEDPLVLIE